MSRRAGVIGGLEQGLSFQSVLCRVGLFSIPFFKKKTKLLFAFFFGGIYSWAVKFLFFEFLPGYLFSPV